MAVTNSIQKPYSHTDVQAIVTTQLQEWTDWLKDRVTASVRGFLGIYESELPERIGTWIHQLCLPHTAGLPAPTFRGKLANPIDLASIPQRVKSQTHVSR